MVMVVQPTCKMCDGKKTKDGDIPAVNCYSYNYCCYVGTAQSLIEATFDCKVADLASVLALPRLEAARGPPNDLSYDSSLERRSSKSLNSDWDL